MLNEEFHVFFLEFILSFSHRQRNRVSFCVSVSFCLLTGVGAVVFGPIQTSILAHLEIEALSAKQPGHDALQLWFCTQKTEHKTNKYSQSSACNL